MPRQRRLVVVLAAVALAAFGVPPAVASASSDLSPSPSSVDYGTIDSHQQTRQVVSLTNTNASGNGADQVYDAYVTGPNASSFYVDNNYDFCSGTTVLPADWCRLTVVYDPQNSPDADAAFLHIDDASGSLDIALTGAAISGTLDASPTSLALGSQVVNGNNGSSQAQVTLNADPTNTTDDHNNPIIVDAGVDIGGNVQITGPDASSFSIAYGNCAGDNLPSNNSCGETINFNPTSPGPKNADLIFTSDAANGATTDIPLTGTGLNGPQMTFSPAQENFGAVTIGSGQAQTLTVTNTGDAPLGIQEAFVVAGSPETFPITADSCSLHQINPAGSCQITVDFSPTSVGEKDASLFFITSENLPVTTVGLSGTGVAPAPAPAPLALSAAIEGDATVGQTLTCAITGAGPGPIDYQWLRNGQAIAGAAAQTLTVDQTDVGAQLACQADGPGPAETATSLATAPVAPPDLTTIPGSLVGASDCRTVRTARTLDVDGQVVHINSEDPATSTAPLSFSARREIQVRIDGSFLVAGRHIQVGPATLAYYADGSHTLSVAAGNATATTQLLLAPCQLALSVTDTRDQAALRISSRHDISSLTVRLVRAIRLDAHHHRFGHITIRTAGAPPVAFGLSSRHTVLDGVTVTISAHHIRITGLPFNTAVVFLHLAIAAPIAPRGATHTTGIARRARQDTTTITTWPRGTGTGPTTASA